MTTPRGAEQLLALEGIEKRFGETLALDGVSLHVRPGTIHALLGENGAGKTTLMRVAYGLTAADAGRMRWGGVPRRFVSPRDALAAGVGMVQQHFSLVPALTVAENIALGGRGLHHRRRAEERVRRLAESTGLAIDERAIVGTLPVSAQQRVEILKALARDVKLLILDEPTATLAPADASALLAWARRFATGDRAVVLITHKLRDALAIADEATVLRRGRNVVTVPAAQSSESDLATAMLGERAGRIELEDRAAGASVGAGPSIARLEDVSSVPRSGAARLSRATLEVRAGEILGVAAVEGNGERELMRILAGREHPARGRVVLPARIGYVPQDRHSDAIADELTVAENVALAGAGARRGWIDWPVVGRRASELMARYDVRGDGPSAKASSLSGGNQQRLVLARELDDAPELVVADQPTRGLDLRATAEVHARLRAARAAGSAVVVHSTDLDEVVALADRVVVVASGALREVRRDPDAIGRAMLGADPEAP
ncbi:MAG: ATP-binding cassette domain-containing protein [Gemmatimonadaceae bacterium]|nr:ATP-binding cassette domain-containing protein [Gemmatimonadaceae bacterium]NUQ94952.1 ATP-binding cassette domain-containing protein [Gemmatimonadaceae bacterium]NUR18198.1 ATP-binding cassette domain-containing protein [Gemmatimonadaceae bacterium]NUS97544.1 ATP-binding cassette domain-containing protein [Gemmatimonadaceae bacterium]